MGDYNIPRLLFGARSVRSWGIFPLLLQKVYIQSKHFPTAFPNPVSMSFSHTLYNLLAKTSGSTQSIQETLDCLTMLARAVGIPELHRDCNYWRDSYWQAITLKALHRQKIETQPQSSSESPIYFYLDFLSQGKGSRFPHILSAKEMLPGYIRSENIFLVRSFGLTTAGQDFSERSLYIYLEPHFLQLSPREDPYIFLVWRPAGITITTHRDSHICIL